MTSKTKRTLQSLLLGTLLIACDGVIVISADGKSEQHYCYSHGFANYNLATCVLKDCPDGFEQVKRADNHTDGNPIFHCLSKVEGTKP